MRFRCIRPDWSKPLLENGKSNPNFKQEIDGPNILEGYFEPEYVKALNEAGYNIYYFPNETSKRVSGWLSGKDVDLFNWVFIDMDLKDQVYASKEDFLNKVAEFPLVPTKIVDSGNGIHVYWKVSNLTDPIIYCGIQRALLTDFKTDDSIWTPLQLMRVEGYYNTKKYGDFKLAEVLLQTDEVYTQEQLLEHLSPLTAESLQKIEHHFDKLHGRITVDIKESLAEEIPNKFLELLERSDYVRGLFLNPVEAKGDRSAADMSLANYLIEKADYDRAEALQVLLHTEKAQSRSGRARFEYANTTLDKACRDRTPLAALSAAETLSEENPDSALGDLVGGPYFMDCLHKPWRKKQMLGLIGPSGGGKTALSLKIMKEFIQNNPEKDDIFFFFNLEMTSGEVIERWSALVGDMKDAYSRLYVVGRDFFEKISEDGSPNIQSIYKIVRDTCKRTGKEAGVLVIDHIDAMEGDFDLTIKPDFNAGNSKYVERFRGQDKKTVVLNKDGILQKLKALAQDLNVFLIIQSQTTKDKDGGGDVPLDKNAAFGSSKFEWYCDMIITICQPLNRLLDHCKEHNLYVTSYRYAKIREKYPDKDGILENQDKLLKYLPDTHDFVGLTDKDKEIFDELVIKAAALRNLQKEKKSTKFGKAPMEKTHSLQSLQPKLEEESRIEDAFEDIQEET